MRCFPRFNSNIEIFCQVLAPCGVNDFVCGRASEWASNGTELCLAAGFGVKQSDVMHSGVEETFCYGGKASLDSIADSWVAPQSEKPHKTGNSELLEDFQQWLQDMPSNERVSWAVGGMVLTAGLLFIRFSYFLGIIKFSSWNVIYFVKFDLVSFTSSPHEKMIGFITSHITHLLLGLSPLLTEG